MKHRRTNSDREAARYYSVNIRWSTENKDFIATCPEFPGLSAFGGTRKEALRQYQLALEGMIDASNTVNLPLPPIHRLEDETPQVSG